MYERIVVGTDLSTTAQVATDRAAALAKKLGAQLYLVHAGSDPGDALEDLAKGYGAETVVEGGNPADVLISQTEALGADLLVVGSVGMSGARRFLLGSVPNKVSHHAGADLLIVKTDPPPKDAGEYGSILVGTDGSGTAMRAVEMAARLAKCLDLEPVVVTAYQPPTEQELKRLKSDPQDPVAQWSSRTKDVPDEFKWRIADAAQAADVLERASEHAAKEGVDAKVRAIEGPAAETLISLAENERFDLIVVGSVGMSGAKRFMLGNVPHRISHHAPTDVLILHTS
ncbi:MAG TPA: universal stress protein [Actinomycetota bacterium]|jgi:nucleotide-binding universal stress UspA family protein